VSRIKLTLQVVPDNLARLAFDTSVSLCEGPSIDNLAAGREEFLRRDRPCYSLAGLTRKPRRCGAPRQRATNTESVICASGQIVWALIPANPVIPHGLV
jgi:hypothetical protein